MQGVLNRNVAAASNREHENQKVSEQSARLVEAFAAAVSEKGYAATTVADIVRHASVSKRTFYECFEDKEACFLVAYEEFASRVIQAIEAAANAPATWEEKLEEAIRTYLGALQLAPALTRAFQLEIHAVGERALTHRRRVLSEFAELLRGFVVRAHEERPEIRSISSAMAMAIVGGINELLLVEMERGTTGKFGELEETALALVRAVVMENA